MPSKKQLRRQFLQQRQAMSASEWQEKSDRICQHLRASNWFQQAHTVFAYLSFRREPTLASLFDGEHQWGIPRCVGSDLVWHHWHPNQPNQPEQLQIGKYGITEPKATLPTLAKADLMLMPAVACDRRGYRLGYGGGFYDRLLAEDDVPPTIGIVFSHADQQSLPIDPWDQPLAAICTEVGLRQPDGRI